MKFAINLFFLFAVFQANAETVLRFQAQVSPHAKRVGDLLLISPDKKHWSKLKLDSQARDGERITKEQIMEWLQHKVGAFNYQWKGKKTVVVKQLSQTKAKDLLYKAQSALAKQLTTQAYTQVELKSKTMLKDSDIPLADISVQLPKNYPIAKRVCVHLNYKKRSIPVWFTVKAYHSVFVAQHQMKSHSIVHQADFTLKKRNIAGLRNAPVTHFPKTIWLTKTLNKNQILTEDDLSTQPEIIQGQKVKVNVQEHGITITAEALAQSDGYIGQTIRMKNPQTNKYFVATVIGKNQAEIAA